MLKFGNTYLNYNGTYFTGWKVFDPLNPYDLPPNTIRVRTSDGNPPNRGSQTSYDTATLVAGTTDVYDVYKNPNYFGFRTILGDCSNLVEILGGNTTNVTNMEAAFAKCPNLVSVSIFDTSNVTNMSEMFSQSTSLTNVPLFNTNNATNMAGMFSYCTSLTNVPLFNTSKVTDMGRMFASCTSLTSVPSFDTIKVKTTYQMFYDCGSLTTIPFLELGFEVNITQMFDACRNIESGILDYYNYIRFLLPKTHWATFRNCGIDTQTGAAELAQIPDDWK